MKQEEKSLLLQDLCARLPYGVMVEAQYKDGDGWKIEDRKILGLYKDGQVYLDCVYTTIDNIKPYLRPMSSMTEEEKKIMRSCGFELILYDTDYTGFANIENCIDEVSFIFMEEFLNAHHFDYHGLIEKGLALEAPEMYNTKTE